MRQTLESLIRYEQPCTRSVDVANDRQLSRQQYLRELCHLHAGEPCLVLFDLCQQKQAPWRRIAILLTQSQDIAEQAFCREGAGWRTNSGVVIATPGKPPPTRLQVFGGQISQASPAERRIPQARGRFQSGSPRSIAQLSV